MGRRLGSKNKVRDLPIGRNDAGIKAPSYEIALGYPKEAASPKKDEYTNLEWKIAEELHSYCMVPGCQVKNHLFGSRRIIEMVQDV
jgi:hypothetical protein